MNENTLCKNICALRKQSGLTQDALAAKLGLTYQAVSKWENSLSCPDVQLLPTLADIFGVSIDSLFGRETPAPEIPETPDALVPVAGPVLPWEDDNTIYVVLYHGHRLITDEPFPANGVSDIPFIYEGPVMNIHSVLSVHVEGDVEGSVFAGGDIDCGNVGGDASAGGELDCGGVGGDVTAGGNIDCGSVDGNVHAEGDIDCGSVEGNVSAGGSVDAGSVEGSINAGGNVDCSSVGGNVSAYGDVDCGSVGGEVHYSKVTRPGNMNDSIRDSEGREYHYSIQLDPDPELKAKIDEMKQASSEYARQKVNEAAARLREARGKAREAGNQSRSYHYSGKNVKADFSLDGIQDKMDDIVNNVEKVLDGIFDKLDFSRGKKKQQDNED